MKESAMPVVRPGSEVALLKENPWVSDALMILITGIVLAIALSYGRRG